MRFLTCEPDTEITGQAITAFGQKVRGVSPLLKKHDLVELKTDEWYPLQNWVNVLNDLSKHNDGLTNYFAMGMEDAKTAFLPAGDLSLSAFLEQWGAIFLMHHRGTNVGSIDTTKIDEKHYQMTCIVTYPDDYMYGIAHGLAKRLLPMGTYYKVWFDKAVQPLDKGGTETVIHIQWD